MSEANLPTDAKARKEYPIARGVLDYFPRAIAEVAHVSFVGNQQHNPGQPMHWARSKSMDHADCVARHLIERGTVDVDGIRHTAKAAWRILAMLQLELEEANAAKSAPAEPGSYISGSGGPATDVAPTEPVSRNRDSQSLPSVDRRYEPGQWMKKGI